MLIYIQILSKNSCWKAGVHMHGADTITHTARYSVTSLPQRFPEPETIQENDVLWVCISRMGVAITPDDPPRLFSVISLAAAGCIIEFTRYLGHLGQTPCYAAEISPGSPLPPGMNHSGVRELFFNYLPTSSRLRLLRWGLLTSPGLPATVAGAVPGSAGSGQNGQHSVPTAT